MIKIDTEKCTKCGFCEAVCPSVVIVEKGGVMKPVHKAACLNCYHCVAVCPSDAITCSEFKLEEFEVIGGSKPASAAGVKNLLLQRRSIREFKNKPVDHKMLEELVEVALRAPTGHNARDTQITVVTDRDLIDMLDARVQKWLENVAMLLGNNVSGTVLKTAGADKFAEMMMVLNKSIDRYKKLEPPRNLRAFYGAPALVTSHSGPESLSGKDDSVIALTHMMIYAQSKGLGATWIGFLLAASRTDHEIKKILGIPTKTAIDAAMVIGWPKYKYKRLIPARQGRVKWID